MVGVKGSKRSFSCFFDVFHFLSLSLSCAQDSILMSIIRTYPYWPSNMNRFAIVFYVFLMPGRTSVAVAMVLIHWSLHYTLLLFYLKFCHGKCMRSGLEVEHVLSALSPQRVWPVSPNLELMLKQPDSQTQHQTPIFGPVQYKTFKWDKFTKHGRYLQTCQGG